MRLLLLIPLLFLVLSCEKDSSSGGGDTDYDDGGSGGGTSFNMKDDVGGTWTITSKEGKETIILSTSGSSFYYDGYKYNGSFSGKSFSGNGNNDNEAFESKLTLKMTSINEISGSFRVTITIDGSSNSESTNITGTRK